MAGDKNTADKQVIQHLNRILRNELTAINQYFLHAKLLQHWGFAKLAAMARQESIDEMKHADQLADRIVFLGGLPNLQDLGRLMIGETPEETLAMDLKLEEVANKDLKAAIHTCDERQDRVSVNLLETILASEEAHVDWLRRQLNLIKALGRENYLQTQI